MTAVDLSWLLSPLTRTEQGRTVAALVKVTPGHHADLVVLAWALSSLANHAGWQRDTRTRLAASRAAVDVIREAASAQPSEPQHRQDLVYLLANLGHALTNEGRPATALRVLDEAIDLQRLILASGSAPEHEARQTLASLFEDRDRALQEDLLKQPPPPDARFV